MTSLAKRPGDGLTRHDPLLTRNLADFATPGVVVEVDPDDAEALGAFEEIALSEADAWASNADAGEAEDFAPLMKPEGRDGT
jgi:hypothetical protein